MNLPGEQQYGSRYMIGNPTTSPGIQSNNQLQNLLSNPSLQTALFSGGGGALGNAIGGRWGGALGAGAGPVVQNLISGQRAPWTQVLTEAAAAAAGGGLGSAAGPLGAGLGGGGGAFLGGQLAKPGALGGLFNRPAAVPAGSYNGASNEENEQNDDDHREIFKSLCHKQEHEEESESDHSHIFKHLGISPEHKGKFVGAFKHKETSGIISMKGSHQDTQDTQDIKNLTMLKCSNISVLILRNIKENLSELSNIKKPQVYF